MATSREEDSAEVEEVGPTVEEDWGLRVLMSAKLTSWRGQQRSATSDAVVAGIDWEEGELVVLELYVDMRLPGVALPLTLVVLPGRRSFRFFSLATNR